MKFDFGDSNLRTDNFQHIERQFEFSKDDLITTQTKSLYKWWSSYQPDFPTRAAFDITEHRSLPPYLYIIEILSPTEFLYRLNGEHVISLIGRSLSSQIISTSSPVYEDQVFADYLCELLKHKSACRCVGNFSLLDRGHINFESVDCPLVNEGGQITHFIGALSDKFVES